MIQLHPMMHQHISLINLSSTVQQLDTGHGSNKVLNFKVFLKIIIMTFFDLPAHAWQSSVKSVVLNES